MFSCEFCEISKNTFFTEQLWATDSLSRCRLVNLIQTIESVEVIDLDEFNMDEFWEKVELNIISKAFTWVKIKSVSLKPNLYFWAPYFGKNLQRCINFLNTEHKKIRRVHESTAVQDEYKKMNEERLLKMLSNETLKKVKKAARSCNLCIVGSKIDIIMRIKAAILTDNSKFRKIFSNIWDHSGGWLVFLSAWSCVLF